MEKISDLINKDRLWERHESLANFGLIKNGGVNRQALSIEDLNARKQILKWLEKTNIDSFTDDIANIFFRLEGINKNLPPVLIGSHIDSQPSGGKYDGVFGVLAGIEVIQTLSEKNIVPEVSIEVVSWMNEEGSRFVPGMMGSAVFTGARSLDKIKKIRDDKGIELETEIKKMNNSLPNLKKRKILRDTKCFLEAHIEQGPVLEMNKKNIGIVTGIQGKRTFLVEVNGEVNHVGTSPRKIRRDAFVSSVNIVKKLHEEIWDDKDIVRFTIGKFTVEPNAPSVVPSRVFFSIDLRHPDQETLKRLGDLVEVICVENSNPCNVKVKELLHDKTLEFPEKVISTIEKISNDLEFSSMRLPSGAGHDARYLHYFCPTGMIFIPCKKGISHSPEESVTKEDLTYGAMVLADTVWKFSKRDFII